MIEKCLPETRGCLGPDTRVLLLRRKEGHETGQESWVRNEVLLAYSVHAAVAQEEENVEHKLRDLSDFWSLGRGHCVDYKQTHRENLLKFHHGLLTFITK